ncbi:MAG TPA: N-acetylmuramic acid 6-phosphate etherase [bacterium (Candidatus Stahlbacteria)]|nr:N-acetylmuramic acid 6-phosphate etherase [Candidatus Stahlbacteria bacterium]
MKKSVFDEIKNLITEQRNPNTMDIDSKSTVEILEIINSEDQRVATIVKEEIPYIAKAVDLIVESFKNYGRLFYVGAGTSGRLGVLDAAECPPTFGTDPDMVQGIIAGGYGALVRAVEGAEDNKADGAKAIRERGVTNKDVVVGLTACRRTPYVIGAIEEARRIGAKTVYITATPRAELKIDVDVAICPVTGPEVIMGSTRMKAGTAEKLILNMLTTTSMIKIGKVYENMMVDLMATSQKLIERSKRTIMIVTGVDYDTAAKFLKKAEGSVKIAIVMILAKVGYEEAKQRLKRSGGFVRAAIERSRND